ncbi:MAG: DNA-binding protein WhiA [Lachnospiraceae bacterium]|nr:DNA-binding protein WhiA [Lachnospiraceae bacterium]
MSFSLNVKKELVSSIPNARHCRIAQLAAVTALSAVLRDGRIVLSSENETVNECFTTLFKKLSGKDPACGTLTEKKGRKTAWVTELTPAETEELLKLLKMQDGLVPNRMIAQQTCCKRAFLKGAFIACGSITDPQKDYHLEFAMDDAEKAAFTAELITSFDIEAKIVNRKKYNVVYLKDGEHIVDVLNIMGAHVSLMELENVRIVKELRNSINRRVNCEAANIGKTTAAANRQIEDIRYLNDTIGLDSLSDELRTTALLRLEYPEASLAELGEKHDRKVGRSGVNHRLQKLTDMAERLRSGKP